MSVLSLDKVTAGLRRRVARSRRLTKMTHNLAIRELLDDLASYLDLEAFIAELQVDPFHNHALVRVPVTPSRRA